jgi:hypothetical protein
LNLFEVGSEKAFSFELFVGLLDCWTVWVLILIREDANEMSARWDELTDQYNRRKGEAAAAVGMAAAGGGGGASRSATNSGGGGGSGAKSDEVAAAQEAVSISISECEDVLQCRAVFAYMHVPTLPA